MRYSTRVFGIVITGVLLLVGGIGEVRASVILDQSNTSNDGYIDAGFSALGWSAQTFTVGISGQLDHIEVDIYLRQSVPGSIQLDLLSTIAGVPTSTVLGATSVPNSSVPYLFPDPPVHHAFVTFDFAALNVNVTQGEVLAIALRSSDPQLIGGWMGCGTNQYAGGEFFIDYSTAHVGWVAYGSGDLRFRTYVDTPDDGDGNNVVPEPAALAVWSFLAIAGIGYGWRRRRKC